MLKNFHSRKYSRTDWGPCVNTGSAHTLVMFYQHSPEAVRCSSRSLQCPLPLISLVSCSVSLQLPCWGPFETRDKFSTPGDWTGGSTGKRHQVTGSKKLPPDAFTTFLEASSTRFWTLSSNLLWILHPDLIWNFPRLESAITLSPSYPWCFIFFLVWTFVFLLTVLWIRPLTETILFVLRKAATKSDSWPAPSPRAQLSWLLFQLLASTLLPKEKVLYCLPFAFSPLSISSYFSFLFLYHKSL